MQGKHAHLGQLLEGLIQDSPVAGAVQNLVLHLVPISVQVPDHLRSLLKLRRRVPRQPTGDELLAVPHISHGDLPPAHLQVILVERRRKPHCPRAVISPNTPKDEATRAHAPRALRNTFISDIQ